jgi:tellurite methyltransferase
VTNPYDERYQRPGFYWGKAASESCHRVLKLLPPTRPLKLLDIGCGEGRNAVFFARNGYIVSAFDASTVGVEKTKLLAAEAQVPIEVQVGDICRYQLKDQFDVLFSTGVLQYVLPELRDELFEDYRNHTIIGGLNAFSVFVEKPFIDPAPDAEPTAHKWHSGELLAFYRDWKIEYCCEEIFDCVSSGVPHKHAVNRVIARRV